MDLFSDGSRQYAAARPTYPDALFDFVAARAPGRVRAWDCGTGSGQAAVSLASRFDEVAASDPSAEQIRNAQRAPNIMYSVQAAEHTSYPSAFFDVICVAQALHWFRLDAFFREARRVARPGALFVAWGYSWFTVSPEFDATFRRAMLDRIAGYWAPNNRLLWNAYADVQCPFERLPTPAFTITMEWGLAQLLAYVGTWSAVRRCVASEGARFLEAAEAELVACWDATEPEGLRRVTMPLHVVAGHFD
ncbi:MAG: class I SAM-dependent methyltransferase [Gammaproteobacteria bacterium]|nr:class I SAM-dependent methyltransferase [Gammaproteobacteria bacterium]